MLTEGDREKFVAVVGAAVYRNTALHVSRVHADSVALSAFDHLRAAGLVEPKPLPPGDYEVFWKSNRRRIARWTGGQWLAWHGGCGEWLPHNVAPPRIGRRLPDEEKTP